MAKGVDSFETVTAGTRADWRAWLAANHATSSGVWLVIHKKNNPEPSGSGRRSAVFRLDRQQDEPPG